MKALRQRFVIKNSRGIHARSAAMLAQTAERFNSDVYLYRAGMKADCKSILSILAMECTKNSEITVEAIGDDADRVLFEIGSLIKNGFGEDGHE